MPTLTTRRPITTGNISQVHTPAELELYTLVQVDSLRKRRLFPVRAAMVAGALVSGKASEDHLSLSNRLQQAWRRSGYRSDAFFRGVVTEKSADGFILDFVHFDFHPNQPLGTIPVVPDEHSLVILERSREQAHFRYEDIGLIAIQPNVPGSDNYHTNDDIGRFSVATVHRMQEPLPVSSSPHER